MEFGFITKESSSKLSKKLLSGIRKSMVYHCYSRNRNGVSSNYVKDLVSKKLKKNHAWMVMWRKGTTRSKRPIILGAAMVSVRNRYIYIKLICSKTKGMGYKLLTRIRQLAKNVGGKPVVLNSVPVNKTMTAYRRWGFKKVRSANKNSGLIRMRRSPSKSKSASTSRSASRSKSASRTRT